MKDFDIQRYIFRRIPPQELEKVFQENYDFVLNSGYFDDEEVSFHTFCNSFAGLMFDDIHKYIENEVNEYGEVYREVINFLIEYFEPGIERLYYELYEE